MADLLIDPSLIGIKETPAPAKQPTQKKGPDKGGFYCGTGRRKSAIARVRIKPGEGKLIINGKEYKEFFKAENDRRAVIAPIHAIKSETKFDVFANVEGGGPTGQAGAVLLGIARALKIYDDNFLPALRDGGYLTRDGRMKERKKYGQKGARKRFQFSKR